MAYRNGTMYSSYTAAVFARKHDLADAHGISPASKGAKLSAEAFTRATGWTGASNQHTRDAAMCAWKYRGAAA